MDQVNYIVESWGIGNNLKFSHESWIAAEKKNDLADRQTVILNYIVASLQNKSE